MTARGEELRPLDEADVRAQLSALKANGVEAVTIALMNAYVNGAHEARVADIAREVFPDVPISVSHEVLPEMQEYERTLTTVANASVRPIVARYVKNLREKLRNIDMQGRIALLRSDGGLMSSEKSEEHPVSLLMSGPAGGVTGALWVARNSGLKNILTLDVGRHLHRRGLDRERRTAPGAHHRRGPPFRARLVPRREDGGGWRRLYRQGARVDQGPARRPRVRRRQPGPGLLWQGRNPGDGDGRQRGAGLSARRPARRRSQA